MTISGTLTDNINADTQYSYIVTVTGGCPTSAVTTTGTIDALANHNMVISAGPVTQTLCEGAAIADIDFTVSEGAAGTPPILVGAPSGLTIGLVAGPVYRLSGTINENIGVSQTYNFDVVSKGNGCDQVTTPVSITVDPDQELTLTSANATQIICEGDSITSITYALAGGATNASVTNLPTGVSYTVSAGVVTISGTPTDDITTSTPTTFTVISTGSCTPAPQLQGTITVEQDHDLTYTGGNVTQTLCEGDAITDIVFTPSAGATIVVGENLPDGLTISPNAGAGTFTLSGTPTAAISSQITYNFNVTTQGNGCTTDPIAISIVVNPDDDISLTSNNNELQTVCEGEAIENITYIL